MARYLISLDFRETLKNSKKILRAFPTCVNPTRSTLFYRAFVMRMYLVQRGGPMDRRGTETKKSALQGALTSPHAMAFLPAVTLLGFWTGGELVLLVLALGLPVLYALFGGFSHTEKAPTDAGPQISDLTDGEALRRWQHRY